MSFRKVLVLATAVLCVASGDVTLGFGMKQVGPISSPAHLLFAVRNPWVALGILFLLGFFTSYLTALSWADLTYVLPATSLGYVLIALFSRVFLHEHVSATRWLGILLISLAVGSVARGPALTPIGELAAVPDDMSAPLGVRLPGEK